MNQIHKCFICGKSDVRLYRPYGEFLRPARFRCKCHIPEKAEDYYVPLIEDMDGSVFGYTSVSHDAIEAWEDLPEATTDV